MQIRITSVTNLTFSMSQHLNPSIECFQGAKGKMKISVQLPSKRQQQLPLAAGMVWFFLYPLKGTA